MAHDPIPFPDLTGLRTTAHDRHISTSHIQTQKVYSINSQKLEEITNKLNPNGTYKDVIIAISFVILTHLLSPEDECNAQIAVWDQDGDQISLQQLDTTRQARHSLQLTPLIQQIIRSDTTDNSIKTNADNAILFCSGNKPSSNEYHELLKDVGCMLIVEHSDQGQILLHIRASPRNHTVQSADLQLKQIDALLKSICEAEDQGDIPIFSTNRFDKHLLASDNDKAQQSSQSIVSGDLMKERFEYQFEKMAETQPNHIALEFRASTKHTADDVKEGNISMTYSEVDEAASQIEQAIRNHVNFHYQTKEGHKVVALFLEKSHWTYIAILAVLKSGAAWCPIDTDWPSARRKALLAKSGASIILTAGKNVKAALLEDLPEGMKIIDLDNLSNRETAQVSNYTHRGQTSDDLAYLIWTSGTTGLPKAVGIQHKAAVQALRSLQEVIPHDDGKQIRYLQFSAYNFDLMILDMFYTWGLGGTLISSTRATLLTDLTGIANATKATHTLLTPAVMAMTSRESIPSLKVVINGGEKLSQTVADIWSEDCCLLNLYGPAEATLIAMNRRVPAKDVVKAPNIGKALSTTSCYAIDAEDNLVIKGAVGQLALGGYQCALGYIGDEAKTNEKFQQHPSLGRIYKTGDMVRQLHNGEFEYLGRVDDQVKVNGIRIELLEINATIRSSVEAIKDSETLLVPAEGAQQDTSEAQIVNFSVVPSATRSDGQLIRLDEEAIQIASAAMKYAQHNLPSYMVPSLFVVVDHFPKTSSAKVDREAIKSALRKIDVLDWQNRLASSSAAAKSQEPSEALQSEGILRTNIAAICLINESKVGRYTPFPQMGLDSIRAITLAKKLNATGLQVSVVDILNYSTLEKLALRIQSNSISSVSQDDKARRALEKFDQTLHPSITSLFGEAQIDRILPCTPLQESLIAETLQDPARYWLHRVYSLPEQNDMTRMVDAVNEVVRQIEVLRIVFVDRHSLNDEDTLPRTSFAQVVLKNVHTKVLELQDSGDPNEEILALQSARLHSMRILDQQCPVGFTYVKHAGKLVMHIHHALYDQISLQLIDKALDKAWRGVAIDDVEPFSKAIPSIIDLDESTIVNRKRAWEDLLSLYPKGEMITLPKLSMLEDQISSSSIESRRLVSSIKYADLALRAQEFGTSARPILQTALAFVLSRLCDAEQILLGDVVSGRAISSHLDNVVGPVLATMAVPILLRGNSTFKTIWDQVSQFHNRALPHAHFSLGQIRQILDLPRTSETFHAVFAFEPPAEKDTSDHESAIKATGNYGIAVEHSLAIEMEVDQSGNLAIVLNNKKGMVDTTLSKQFIDELESAILQLLCCPDVPLSSIELGKNESIESVSHFQIPESIVQVSHLPCYTRFYQHCKANPDCIAVEFHERIERPLQPSLMSYSQLLQKSQKLAQHLLAGVPSKSVIAVTLPRSFDSYIALLAILQAGYIYLPIDIALPDQRKKVLLRESKAKGLICHTSTAWLKKTDGNSDVQEIPINELAWQQTSYETKMPTVDMQDPAYILFTSGSTGIPKGCVLSHENLSAALASFGQVYDEFAPGSLEKDVRFLARSIESFDVALLEALLPLQYGATIVTAPRHVTLSDLGKAMQNFEVTHAAVVPSLFYIERRRVLPSDLPNLRALIVGGERLPKDILTNWSSSIVPLLNAYGPTEACIGTSIARVRPNLSTGNVGKPFGSTQYVVLKKRSEGLDWSVAMRGESGELCIAGLQVGQYLGQIASDAFIEWQGQRLYRTGDEVFMWPDDSIEYLGRIHGDTQVKVRGVRIELGEIDHVISQNEQDIRTITRYIYHPRHKHQIVMFAALSTSSTRSDEIRRIDSEDGIRMGKRLFKRCRDGLPSYMVPSAIMALNYLPLAAISGKFDVKRLATWYISQSEVEQLHSEDTQSDDEASSRALTDVEQIVKNQIICMFDMAQSKLKLSTDLFALGLDSLNIIALCGALHRSGLQVEISQAMSSPSIEGIANHSERLLDGQKSEIKTNSSRWAHLTAAAQKAVGANLSVEYALPCLPLQASMVSQTLLEFQQWQEMPSEAFRPRYINISRYKASSVEVVSAEKVKEAFQAILSRHSIYRTVFVETDHQITQAVLSTFDLSEVYFKKDVEWEEAAVRSLAESMHHCPPLRYQISQESDSQDIYLDLVIHHALYDGVSLDSLFAELGSNLASGEGGVKVNSSNFASILETFEDVKIENRLKYWQKALDGCSINFFPCLTGYQVDQQHQEFDQLRLRLTTPLSNVQLQAKEKKATVAMLILHAFAELYSKYVGESDVIIGLVLNGRSSETEDVHGPCVNTVPFRYQHEKDADAIQQVRRTYAEALQYQHVALADLARHFEAPNGLFNTLFSFSGSAAKRKRNAFEEIHSNLLTEYPFAIEVGLDEEQDEVDVLIAFNTSFIPIRQVKLFIAQLDSILNGSHQTRRSANIVREELSMQNQDADKVTLTHFVDMFSEQVNLRPREVAFTFTQSLDDASQTFTYEELNKVTDMIACNLSVYPGDIVGVHMSQCAEVYPLLVGIWKAGKTYLPLDPKLPADRLDYIVSITKPSIVVVLDKSTVHSLSKTSKLFYSEVCSKILNPGGKTLKPRNLSDLAYIMFTSGSSGKPKGVEISHRALAAALRSWKEILPHRPSKSRILQLASPGFDVFLIEVCMPLALGFSFASAPKEVLLDDLEKTFHRLQLTMADLPAALASTVHPSNLPKLEWLMSGGEQMDQRVIDAWSRTGLINAWGPTEATIGNTLGFVEQGRNRNWIGYAYPTSSLYILQPDCNEILPRGCIGEIAVGGPQLANGYYGNPSLTAEKFIDVLIPGQSGEKVRLYRTGDRGRILSDGSVECHGRIEGDGQVKINSQRVELEEIEIALKRQNGITNASVLYLEHPKIRSRQLVAFLTANTGLLNGSQDYSDEVVLLKNERRSAELSEQCLTNLSQSLPTYMVPRHCFILGSASLPLTPNNKVDTRRLKAFYATLELNSFRDAASTAQPAQTAKPMTEMEKRLQKLISEFAGVSQTEIECQTSLYRFGIDSISGLRLARFLRDHGVKGIRAQVIFASPTVASIAASIERSGMTTGKIENDVSIPIPGELKRRMGQDGNYKAFPCTPLQNGMLLESLVKEGSLYILHQAFRFKSELLEQVKNAVATLCKRHEVLRSSFYLIDGQFIQIVDEKVEMPVDSVVEMSLDMSEQDRIRQIQKQHQAVLSEEKGLESGSFLASIIKAERDSHLILTLHHALYDGESLELLINELKQLVKSGTIDETGPQYHEILPALLPSPHAAEFWVQRLLNRQESLINKSSLHSQDSHSLSSDMNIPTNDLVRFAREMSISIHTIVLFSYAKLLASLTGQLCVTFAEIFTLRNTTDMEGTETIFGPCFNTILTSIEVRENESNIDALQRLQREIDQGREYRNASLADIQRGLIKRRGDPCKIDALFNMQVLSDQPITTDNDLITLHELDDDDIDAGQYALNVEFVQRGGRLSLVVKAHKESFTKVQLSETVKRLESILSFIMEKPDVLSTKMPWPFNSLEGLPSGLTENNAKQSRMSHGMQMPRERNGESPIQSLMLDTIGSVLQINPASISSQTLLPMIGLDSIASMHLAARLRKNGVKIGVADIIQGKTVDGILAKMKSREDESAKVKSSGELQMVGGEEKFRIISIAEQTGRNAKEIEACLAILPGQFFELIQSGETGMYTFAYRYKGGVDLEVNRLQNAWSELQDRHSILRTSFLKTDGSATNWDQIVLLTDTNAPSKIVSHTTNRSFMTAIEEDGLDRFTAEIQVPLRPGQCPARLSLIHSSEGDVLLIRLHHALYDAWSLPMLMEDLGKLYDGQKLEDVPDYTAYVRHITQQRRKLSNVAQDYWKKLLGDQQVARIPCHSEGDADGRQGKSFMFLQYVLTDIRKRERTASGCYGGLPALIMASWATMLTFISDPASARISTFGLYLTGRSESFDGIERMTGNLTNIVPVVASMEETNRCLHDISKSVLWRVASQIKIQLDEHSHLDSFTSIKDILDWTGNDAIPWNSTLNLLWPKGDHSLDQKEESAFTMIEELLIRPYENTDNKFERSSGSIDAYANVQIDIQSDPKSDALHLGIKWDNALWSSSQVNKIMHDFCQLIRLGSGEE